MTQLTHSSTIDGTLTTDSTVGQRALRILEAPPMPPTLEVPTRDVFELGCLLDAAAGLLDAIGYFDMSAFIYQRADAINPLERFRDGEDAGEQADAFADAHRTWALDPVEEAFYLRSLNLRAEALMHGLPTKAAAVRREAEAERRRWADGVDETHVARWEQRQCELATAEMELSAEICRLANRVRGLVKTGAPEGPVGVPGSDREETPDTV